MIDQRLEGKLGFDRIRSAIAARCSSDYAAERAEKEEFSVIPDEIRSRLLLADEMRLVVMFEDSFPNSGYIDALPFLTPLLNESCFIDCLSLAKLGTILGTMRGILNFLGSVKDSVYPNLKHLAAPVKYYPEISRRIETVLDKYGEIKDSASPALSEIRRDIREKEASISKRAAMLMARAIKEGLAEEGSSVTIRDGKYLIPVATAEKRKLPGIVAGESATGKTSFIEPSEIVEIENDLADLHFAEEREIERILQQFTEYLRPYVQDLIDMAVFLGEVDFLMAKAGVALEMIAGMPVISKEGELRLHKARHPLLQKALKKEGREIVPLSVDLNPGKHILLISGPNAGGKSVCLKTVGLLQYMFQWGMLIPTSESSELPVFKRIIASIGDDQSLENDLSTYSSFLSDMKQMLREADAQTLVLIDEFGSGTEPAAGGAIAEAILAELDKRGVYGIITTHYTNLKLYASAAETGVLNAAMQFDSSRIEPLFKLEPGMPGNSFAFELARKMGLPENIVKDAEDRAGEEYVGIERNLRKIARGKRAIDERLQKIKNADRTLEGLTSKYEKELQEIRDQKKEILENARREAENIVRGAGREVEKTIRVIKENQADKEKTKEARAGLQDFVKALEQRKSRDEYVEKKLRQLDKRRGKNGKQETTEAKKKEEAFKIGEKVKIVESGLVGEIIKVSSKSVTLSVGNVTSIMSPDKLTRISSNEFREATRREFKPVLRHDDPAVTARKLEFKSEIDLRGARLSEALETTMHYIDDAIMVGVGSVRIIHGKGTGVLREEIQKYVRTVPGVKVVHDEDVRAGGSGVSIVEFE